MFQYVQTIQSTKPLWRIPALTVLESKKHLQLLVSMNMQIRSKRVL